MAKQKKSKMALYTRQDKIVLYCGYALLGLFLLAIIVPIYLHRYRVLYGPGHSAKQGHLL